MWSWRICVWCDLASGPPKTWTSILCLQSVLSNTHHLLLSPTDWLTACPYRIEEVVLVHMCMHIKHSVIWISVLVCQNSSYMKMYLQGFVKSFSIFKSHYLFTSWASLLFRRREMPSQGHLRITWVMNLSTREFNQEPFVYCLYLQCKGFIKSFSIFEG